LVRGQGRRQDDLELWWVPLLQANVVAAALAALPCLAVAPRVYDRSATDPRAAPLLTLQVFLALVGSLLLLAGPAALLVARPAPAPASLAQAGSVGGWLASL